MTGPVLRRVVRAGRWVQSRLVSGAVILGYHRVATEEWDPLRLCVSPAHFEEHLSVLQRTRRVVAVGQLVNSLRSGRVMPGAVALTLDDGYADCLLDARPLIERYAVPATVYVVSGNFGRSFWWDELVQIVGAASCLPSDLRLRVGERTITWRSWGRTHRSARLALVRRLRLALRDCEAGDQSAILDRLRRWAGTTPGTVGRAMTRSEVADLAASELIEIGAHTESHPLLPHLSEERQRNEMERSRQVLEEVTGRPVRGLAYPYGSTSRRTGRIARETAFEYAVGGRPGLVWRGSGLMDLPRLSPPNVGGEQFRRWLGVWVASA